MNFFVPHINFIVFSQLLIINFLYYIFFDKIKFLFPVDYPDTKIKKHNKAIPLSGGIIFILTFSILYLNSFFFQKYIYLNLNLYLFSFLIFALGFIDDYLRLSYIKKFIILFVILFLFIFFNESFQIKSLIFSDLSQIDRIIFLGNLNPLFTIFCILAFINAVNLFDGADLQCGLFFLFLNFFLLFKTGNIIFLYFIIPNINFLILNYYQKSFLGDSGAFLFSFIISIYIIYFYNLEVIFADEIFILMMLPGIDMLRLFFERILNKKDPFKGDRRHIHHILLRKFSYKIAILISMILILFPIFLTYVFKINTILSGILSFLLYLGLIIFVKKTNNPK